jgi:hypothetical protein
LNITNASDFLIPIVQNSRKIFVLTVIKSAVEKISYALFMKFGQPIPQHRILLDQLEIITPFIANIYI